VTREVAAPGPTEVVLCSLQHHMVSPISQGRGCHHHRRASPQGAELNPTAAEAGGAAVVTQRQGRGQDNPTPRGSHALHAQPCCHNHHISQAPTAPTTQRRQAGFYVGRQTSCFPHTELLNVQNSTVHSASLSPSHLPAQEKHRPFSPAALATRQGEPSCVPVAGLATFLPGAC